MRRLFGGEIRAYGREIRGEISQHLAPHMHTFPAGRWSLRSEHGGHERGISTVAKGRRFFHYLSLALSLSLNLAFSLSLSFILSPLAFPTSLFLSTLLWGFQECMCVTAVVSFLSENGGSKMSNTCQTLAETGAVWMCKEEKHYMLRGFFKWSTSRPLWLTSWGHGFALPLSLTHTYGSLMSHRSLHLPGIW